ncbi:MAG TPA: 50S ribosomal protein L25 [Treponemataceae bacterium]|jgi:large subunit ribosomal protein L25|nr:50S ribosomal protein L25 [Treponemataceae bacterium]
MEQLGLKANKRSELGKKAALKIRKEGKLPAVVYNTKGEATALTIKEDEFTKIWKQATPTTLINLDIDGTVSKAFIQATDYDIISDKNLHVDFHIIDESAVLKRSIKMQVAGNPVGVREGGRLEKGVKSIVISCLPKDLPVRIVADVSKLKLGDSLYVKDLNLGEGVTVVSDTEDLVASVAALV